MRHYLKLQRTQRNKKGRNNIIHARRTVIIQIVYTSVVEVDNIIVVFAHSLFVHLMINNGEPLRTVAAANIRLMRIRTVV